MSDLLQAYLVCSDTNKSDYEAYQEIQNWLKSSPSTVKRRYPEPFHNDIQQYKMRNVFGYNPEMLLDGYIRSHFSDYYFMAITKVTPTDLEGKFLNCVEKAFYLTHGYGRPNIHINHLDLNRRNFLMNCTPTAVTMLSAFTEEASQLQDVSRIKNKLSFKSLVDIPDFILKMMRRVTQITERGFSQRHLQTFMKSIGVLPVLSYDSAQNVYRSNLAEIELYKKVLPDRLFSYSEISEKPEEYVREYINTLADDQLMAIMKFKNITTWSSDYLRSSLLRLVFDHYLSTKVYVDFDTVYTKRTIDGDCTVVPKHEYFKRMYEQKVFHNGTRLMSVTEAYDIEGLSPEDQQLFEEIKDRTLLRFEESKTIVSKLTEAEKQRISNALVARDFGSLNHFYVFTPEGKITSLSYADASPDDISIESIKYTLQLLEN